MVVFVLGALFSYLAFSWNRRHENHLFLLSMTAAFTLSLNRDPFVVFLALFIAPTLYRAIASARRTAAGGPFALFAISDLLLVIALTVRFGESFDWSFPGSWTAGAPLVAIAGAVRLLGAARSSDAIGALFMWQGLFLSSWAAGQAAPGATLAALGLFAAAAWGKGFDPVASFGSGVALAMAAAGMSPAALVIMGLAIVGSLLGERAISMWVVLVAPLSIAAHFSVTDADVLTFIAASAAFVLWVWAAGRIAMSQAASGGRVASCLAAIGTLLVLLDRAPELVIWLGYAMAITLAVVYVLLKPSRVALDRITKSTKQPPEWGGYAVAGWAAAGLTVILLVRLVGLGASTGFL